MTDKQDLSKSKWIVAAGVSGLLLGGWYYWSQGPNDDEEEERQGDEEEESNQDESSRPRLGERRNIRPGTIAIPREGTGQTQQQIQGTTTGGADDDEEEETVATTITPTFPPPAYNFGKHDEEKHAYNPLAKNKVIVKKILSYLTPMHYNKLGRINKTWRDVMEEHEYWRENCRVVFGLSAVFAPKEAYVQEHQRVMSYPTKEAIQKMMEQAQQEGDRMSRSEADLMLQVSKATQLFETSYGSLDYVLFLLNRIGGQIALHESISPDQHQSLTARLLMASGQWSKVSPYLTNAYERGTQAKFSGIIEEIQQYNDQLLIEEPGFAKAYVGAQLLYPFFGRFDAEKARSLLFDNQKVVAYNERITVEQFRNMNDFAQVSILLGYTNGGLFVKDYAHALKLFNELVKRVQNPVICNILANFYNMYCHFGVEEVNIDELQESEHTFRMKKAIEYWKKAGSIPRLLRVNLHQMIMGVNVPDENDLNHLMNSITERDLRKLEFPEVTGFLAHLHMLKMYYWPSQHQNKEWFHENILTPLHYASNSGCEVGHILLGNLYECGCKFFGPNVALADYYYQRGLQFNSETCALFLVHLWWKHGEALHAFRKTHPNKNTMANPPISYVETTLAHPDLKGITNLNTLADAFFKLFIHRHGCCRTLIFAKMMYYGGFPSLPHPKAAKTIIHCLIEKYNYTPAASFLNTMDTDDPNTASSTTSTK